MINANEFPDITTMSLDEAKEYLLLRAKRPGDSHDVYVDSIAQQLLEAAQQRRRAQEVMRGSNVQTFYGSASQYPDAPYTSILYDAAWELVGEGILRPGPRFVGVLNERPNGFSLTAAGKARVGEQTNTPF